MFTCFNKLLIADSITTTYSLLANSLNIDRFLNTEMNLKIIKSIPNKY